MLVKTVKEPLFDQKKRKHLVLKTNKASSERDGDGELCFFPSSILTQLIPRAWDKVVRGMCKHYGAQPPPGRQHCFSAVYLAAVVTHTMGWMTVPTPGREQGPVRWQILSGCAGDGGIWGVSIHAGHQLFADVHALTCSPPPPLKSPASQRKQWSAWRCHTEGKYFSVVLHSSPRLMPRTSEPSDCCATHTAKCEIGTFTKR